MSGTRRRRYRPITMRVHPAFYDEVKKLSSELKRKGLDASMPSITEIIAKRYRKKKKNG